MPSSAPLDLPALLETAIDIAKQAGARIKAGSESRFKNATGVDEKKNSVDLVTETDQAVEKFVAETLRAAYPDHQFIGEESYAAGERHELSDEPTWIVDPIDGTTNFVVGFPFSCISIGLAFEGKPVLGVVYNPFLDQLYSAAKGHGAFFNRTTRLPLVAPPPSMKTISQALIGHEWGSDRSQATMDLKLKAFGNLFGQGEGKAMARGGRSMGSAALNFCAVAAGQLDCYWEIGCWEWDVCAGIAIAEEAGGRCFGGKQSTLSGDDEMNAALVCGRKYFVIRGLPEGGREAQAKLAREFYGYIEEWDQ